MLVIIVSVLCVNSYLQVNIFRLKSGGDEWYSPKYTFIFYLILCIAWNAFFVLLFIQDFEGSGRNEKRVLDLHILGPEKYQ